jgi:hypothetical protein
MLHNIATDMGKQSEFTDMLKTLKKFISANQKAKLAEAMLLIMPTITHIAETMSRTYTLQSDNVAEDERRHARYEPLCALRFRPRCSSQIIC